MIPPYTPVFFSEEFRYPIIFFTRSMPSYEGTVHAKTQTLGDHLRYDTPPE